MQRHIYIYSPSAAVRDRNAFKRAVRRLQAMGHAVELDQDVFARETRFAGDDATRVAAIGRAADSGANIAIISRGGYGLTRVLADLPYKRLAKAVERGTAFVGMSDFTAMQAALFARNGTPSWAGPSVEIDFGTEAEPDDIMQACFDDLAQGQGEGTGWRWPLADYKAAQALEKNGQHKRAYPAELQIKGTLWGGNLAVLTALVGTKWMPQVPGGILFLEDVAEHPYRIERMLSQLQDSGVLAQQKAVVLGQFTAYRLAPHDRGFGMPAVLAWLRSRVKIPVLTGLPFGHVETKVVLPFGQPVTLVTQERDIMLLWAHSH